MGTRIQKALASRVERDEQLMRHERTLRRYAAKLRTAAAQLDLAATYAGDGATLTAQAITVDGRGPRHRSTVSLMLSVVRALNGRKWAT